MDNLIAILVTLVIIVALAWVAKYIIDNFIPPPMQAPAMLIVGLLLLIVLLYVVVRATGVPRLL